MDKYVCDFKIAVHGIDLVKSPKAVDNLFEESSCLVFGQSLLLIEIAFQISSVAELHGYKLRAFRGESIYIPDNIFVFALFQNVYFCLDELL